MRGPNKIQVPSAATAAIWLAILVAPLFLDDWGVSQFAQYVTYGIFAMSLSFVWGHGGMLCFGQAIFFGIGAYLMALTTLEKFSWFGGSQTVGLLLAICGPAIAAHLLGRVLFGGKGLQGAYFAIVTLCAAVIVEITAQHWRFIGGFNGLLGVPPLTIAWRDGVDAYMTSIETYYAVFFAALAVFAGLTMIVRSPFGSVLAAIRGDENRTRYFGYETARFKIFAFTISGAIAGLAGALFTAQFGFVSPALCGFALSTEVLIWVAVGGRGVLMAAFLGAILVRSVESYLSDSLGNYWLMALGILFVATVVLAPQGVFGRWLNLPLPKRLRPLKVDDKSAQEMTGMA